MNPARAKRFAMSKAWRSRWDAGLYPTRYDPLAQPRVDAEFHQLALEAEDVPGGATELDPAWAPEPEVAR